MFKENLQTVNSNGNHIAAITAPAVSELRSLKKGDFLFLEGDNVKGIYILHVGRVKLSTTLADGKTVIVHIAGPGSIVGLNAVIGKCEHEVAAEAIEPVAAEFIRTERVRMLMTSDAAFALRVADEMALRYRSAHALICTLAKSDPILIKLARLVTEWLDSAETLEAEMQNVYTHQQIAEMLGTTRETITRAFRYLRERRIVTLKGHLLKVHDLNRLRALASRGVICLTDLREHSAYHRY